MTGSMLKALFHRTKGFSLSMKEYRMKIRSRIYLNPVTKEIEIEGSESFVTTYFDKLQQLLPGSPDEEKEEPKVAKVFPVKKIKVKKEAKVENPVPKKVIKAAKGKISDKKGKNTLINTVIGFIQGSRKGITTSELMEKTGLTPKQIWSFTSRAAKLGKIKRSNRGTYVATG